jgi:Ca2+-binding RTX toxin-like protein
VGPFGVHIRGFAAEGTLYLRFRIGDEAVEVNDDYDCGAQFTGFASRTHYLRDSLESAQNHLPGGYIRVDQHQPRIGRISYLETGTLSNGSTYRWKGDWTFTITAPPSTGRDNDRDSGGGAGPGSSTRPNRSTRVCTIQGTARRDLLVGTSRDDVICGLGGNDLIKGLAGNDLVFGGPGRDTIVGGPGIDSLYGNNGNDVFNAKDGERDTVIGGRGKDRAKVDKGKDTIRSVERKSS